MLYYGYKNRNLIILTLLVVVSIVMTCLLKYYIENINSEIAVIQNDASGILENIYKTPVVLKLIKNNERNFIVDNGLKLFIYGNYIFKMSSSKLNGNILVYWEIDEDLLKITKIEKYTNREMVFQK
jgi:hypothetical protein